MTFSKNKKNNRDTNKKPWVRKFGFYLQNGSTRKCNSIWSITKGTTKNGNMNEVYIELQ